jgi:hypothetical protein
MRRDFLILLALSAWLPALARAASDGSSELEVYKSPKCGCCKYWIRHLEANGFKVKAHDVDNLAVRRQQLGMPKQYASCHTARIAGYAIEGHVPAADIKRLLTERPQAIGLAVPNMPVGTPGMDGPAYKGRRDAYEVLLVGGDGVARSYARYEAIK